MLEYRDDMHPRRGEPHAEPMRKTAAPTRKAHLATASQARRPSARRTAGSAGEPGEQDPAATPAFPEIWPDGLRHDLASSDSETLSLSSLLALADDDDMRRWDSLSLGYTGPRGAPWLRGAIAHRHAAIEADAVVVCAGAQEALSCVAQALLEPGDHAVVVLPIYGPSERAVTALCEATGVPLAGRSGWRLDVDRVAAALRPSTQAVFVNFPNSPTGAVLEAAELDALVALCRRHGLWLVNDEVYRQTDPSADGVPMVADVYERGISINGLSKGFGLPGLRVGWVTCRDQALLVRVLAAKNALSTCVAATSEVLASIALRAEPTIVARTRAIGERNRQRLTTLLDRLPDLFEADLSRNLAFAFPRYSGPEGSDRLATRLLRQAGLHLLSASLWRSPLALLPTDHVRIGLGHLKHGPGLDALETYLSGQGRPPPRSCPV